MNPLPSPEPTHLRFTGFELDVRSYELRKDGRKIHLQDQPAKLLAILVSRSGELVTRGEIQKALWADNIVEFEHGINTAIKKIREALEDSREELRLIETLPKKGYRFLAPVERACETPVETAAVPDIPKPPTEEVFAIPLRKNVARSLFVFIQVGYLAMYVVALYKMDVLQYAVEAAGFPGAWVTLPLVYMMCGIAVRIYLMSAVGWNHPDAGRKYHKIFLLLLVFDAIWAASPLLATEGLGSLRGLALAGVAGLAYLPFAQRTLVRCLYPTRDAGLLG